MPEKKEKKWYVVWNGVKCWIFETRDEVKPLVIGFAWAKYKWFASYDEAKIALDKWFEEYYQPEKKWNEKDLPFVKESIAVDAACSWSWGVMEYQGIDLIQQKKVFSFKFEEGTNNIWEFLAIVHWLAWIKEKWLTNYSLYSDSMTAISWVRKKRCNSSYAPKNQKLMDIIKKAEKWLTVNNYSTPLLKRNTENWWEIPADFWRK